MANQQDTRFDSLGVTVARRAWLHSVLSSRTLLPGGLCDWWPSSLPSGASAGERNAMELRHGLGLVSRGSAPASEPNMGHIHRGSLARFAHLVSTKKAAAWPFVQAVVMASSARRLQKPREYVMSHGGRNRSSWKVLVAKGPGQIATMVAGDEVTWPAVEP